jgi:hypothetical protein
MEHPQRELNPGGAETALETGGDEGRAGIPARAVPERYESQVITRPPDGLPLWLKDLAFAIFAMLTIFGLLAYLFGALAAVIILAGIIAVLGFFFSAVDSL